MSARNPLPHWQHWWSSRLLPAQHAQEANNEDGSRGEVSFTDDSLQFRYIDSGDRIDAGRDSQISGTLFLSEDRDIVLSGDILFPASLNYDQLQILFGPRFYAACSKTRTLTSWPQAWAPRSGSSSTGRPVSRYQAKPTMRPIS